MKNVTLFTKYKIESKDISEKLIKDFPRNKVIVANDENQLFIGKYPNNLYIRFEDSIDINDPLALLYTEFKQNISFNPININELFYHKNEVLKYALLILLKIYPELLVYDDITEFFGKAEDFLQQL